LAALCSIVIILQCNKSPKNEERKKAGAAFERETKTRGFFTLLMKHTSPQEISYVHDTPHTSDIVSLLFITEEGGAVVVCIFVIVSS
jgi:hypothetical protein